MEMKATTQPTFHIAARRWFDRRNGNTYHSVTIFQSGTIVAEAPLEYGYGEHYLQTATDLLRNLGTLPAPVQHSNGSTEPLWQWAERAGFVYSVDVIDVMRKRDL